MSNTKTVKLLGAFALVSGVLTGLGLLLSLHKTPAPTATESAPVKSGSEHTIASTNRFAQFDGRKFKKMSVAAWKAAHPNLHTTNQPKAVIGFHLLPVDQNLSGNTFKTLRDGRRAELSPESRVKTLQAMTCFSSNVERAGLLLDPGDITRPVQVITAQGSPLSTATTETANAIFQSKISSSDVIPPTVCFMSAIGQDPNGVNRDFHALTPGGPSLTALSNPDLYQVKCTDDETMAAVMNFVSLQVPDADYVLSEASRYRFPDFKPIVVFVFTPVSQYGVANPVNALKVDVMDAGPEVTPSHPKLVGFDDYGVLARKQGFFQWKFPKPQTLNHDTEGALSNTNTATGQPTSSWSLPASAFGLH